MQHKVIIIAEAGVNHNGSIDNAKKLIDVAVKAGVDYVKFQTFKTEKLVSKKAKKAEYQQNNINEKNDTQFEMLKKLELSLQNHQELINYCEKKKIKFLSTAFDLDSLDYLKTLNIDFFKVPSGEITNKPYLKKIASFGEKIVLSTGMSTMNDIHLAMNTLLENNVPLNDISILHCNTEYPTPFSDVNLKAMNTIASTFKVQVGYSDHTLGIEVPIAAVALGATIIEKHFTLDKTMEGPDHQASLEPLELIAMVKSIRNIEKAIAGDGQKTVSESEQKNLDIARKSIHINKSMLKGHVISENDLSMQRPGNGISPMDMDKVIGKKLTRDVFEEHLLVWGDIL